MNWELVAQVVQPEVHHFRVFSAGKCLTFEQAASLLQYDAGFQSWFTDQLKAAPMSAYFWETPPVSRMTLQRNFEYVLIDAPSLAAEPANRSPFVSVFSKASAEVAAFSNLGGDAMLVAPLPLQVDDDYAHLASFVRSAPQRQIDALWRVTSEALNSLLAASATCWVSTSGLGVAWVHIRLDSRPKYYNYAPYKKSP